jgi:preprotein translocase subunit YajC
MSPKASKLRFLPVLLAIAFCLVLSPRSTATDVLTGIIDKVDSAAKTIAVRTDDGTVQTVKFTEKTTVSGLKDAAKGADLVGKEGGHIIVHTAGEGADKTADSVHWLGDRTVHTTEGTVDEVGAGAKTVAVKTADGTKETFEVADHATVDTGKSVARYSAQGAKKGEHVTVFYTEEAGKKIAHVFKHL